jgi:hypothetical protein
MRHVNKMIYLAFFVMCLGTSVFADDASGYRKAILRSSLHQLGVPSTQLTTIQGANVNMVVFTTYDGYRTSDTALSANVWTTVASDTKRLCTQYVMQHRHAVSPQQLNVWLAKLLGLPVINADKRRFVEIEAPVIQAYYGKVASAIGIFRPCTDPRIGAHLDGSPSCPTQMNQDDVNISSDYKTWFINSSIAAHTVDKGMPWTEYGYTYNWNKEASSTMGVAEFVVLKGTPVTVLPNPHDAETPYVSAADYCGLLS